MPLKKDGFTFFLKKFIEQLNKSMIKNVLS
jgi:hypothetical protein